MLESLALSPLSLPPLPLPAEWLARGESSLILLPIGLLLLVFGRRLFWLLVALVGAIAGLWLATEALGLDAGVPSLVAAVAAGLVGALLALLLQKVAVGMVGFLAGVWGTLVVLDLFAGSPALTAASDHVEPTLLHIVLAVLGGVLGAVLAARLFEAALIVLSAVAGALLLVQVLLRYVALTDPWAWGAFLGLALVGILAQTRGRRRSEPEDD